VRKEMDSDMILNPRLSIPERKTLKTKYAETQGGKKGKIDRYLLQDRPLACQDDRAKL
jgi:hypothetical protein